MATSLFIRAPFATTATTTASDYTITDAFLGSGELRVEVDAGESTRLALMPAFPGTLTFKPHPGQEPAPNPADPSANAVTGDLFLELTDPTPFRRLAAIAHFAYPLLLAYLDVALTPSFFQGTVVTGRIADPLGKLPRRPGAAQRAHAFAKGDIGVQVSPTREEPGCVMPSLLPPDNQAAALAAFRFGVRTHLNPLLPQSSLAALSRESILAAPDFVPLPLAFFYGMLKRLPTSHWTELAAHLHVAHPFFDALEALEDDSSAGRWRRLRVFPPGRRRATPLTSGSVAMLEARATEPGGAELWRRQVNRLGEVFVKRVGNEAFDLHLVDRLGASQQTIPISEHPDDDPAPSLSLQWGGTPDAGDAGLDVTSHLPVDGDPTDASLFFELMEGMKDQAGVTVDPIAKEVVCDRRLVRPLQQLLAQFGFALVGAPRDTFDRATAWAVREFQTYARLTTVARLEGPLLRYAERLVATDNTEPYTGEITGIVDAATAAALRVWRDNQYVCPVVVESWQMAAGARTTVARENIWFPTDDTTSARRMFARDVSGYYSLPATRSPDEIILGRYESDGSHHGMLCAKYIGTAWTPETDVTPDRLVGPATVARSPGTISTYKVIAAMAQAENEGVFDVLNGWDRGVMSLGVCHWTVYLKEGAAELPAFLAYLRRTELTAFERFFSAFGIVPDREWPETVTDSAVYVSSQAKWAAHVLMRGLGASKRRYPHFDERIVASASDANFLRTWHWFYRWVMAARTSEAVQRRQWDAARLRLRQLLDAPWKASRDSRHFASIGQVFSSERAAAALLRAHVNAPGAVLKNGRAADRLMDAVKQAGLQKTDPSGWSAAQLTTLHQKLDGELKDINGSINDTLDLATGYVDPTHGALSAARNSFQFDATGL